MAKLHVKGATLTIGGSAVNITTGELTTTVEPVEVPDTGSGGHMEYLPGGGLESGDFNFSAFFDDAALPSADPPNIRAGAIEPFVLTLSTGKTFSGNIFIEEVNYALGDVSGSDAITYEVTGHISEPLTYPTP
jgi:hypothetical protein